MTLVVTASGYRVIAERTNSYRPDEDAPRYQYNNDLKSEINPLGIESCIVKIYKQDSLKNWYPVSGIAYWDEFAAIDEYNGNKKLKGKWREMPRHMLAKCAEVQALRKAFPEDFDNLYIEEEVDHIDARLATEILVADAEKQRALKVKDASKTISVYANDKVEAIECGKFYDYMAAQLRTLTTEKEIERFQGINSIGLQQFWVYDKTAALELKKLFETTSKKLVAPALENKPTIVINASDVGETTSPFVMNAGQSPIIGVSESKPNYKPGELFESA
jgi:RecT family.